ASAPAAGGAAGGVAAGAPVAPAGGAAGGAELGAVGALGSSGRTSGGSPSCFILGRSSKGEGAGSFAFSSGFFVVVAGSWVSVGAVVVLRRCTASAAIMPTLSSTPPRMGIQTQLGACCGFLRR